MGPSNRSFQVVFPPEIVYNYLLRVFDVDDHKCHGKSATPLERGCLADSNHDRVDFPIQ